MFEPKGLSEEVFKDRYAFTEKESWLRSMCKSCQANGISGVFR